MDCSILRRELNQSYPFVMFDSPKKMCSIYIIFFAENPADFLLLKRCLTTVDGRNPANQLRLVVYPIIYKVLYIPGGSPDF